MKTRLLKIGGIVIAAALLLILILTLTIDRIVKSSLERTGSTMLRTEFSVDRVNISLFDGTGSIDGISISNPEGFEEGSAMTILSMHIAMSPASLLSDTVLVHELRIQRMETAYELQPEGSNLGRLRRNLEAYSEATEPTDINIIIDRFLMEETSLTVHTPIDDAEPVTVTLPRVEHTGIGRDTHADMASTLMFVLEAILDQVTGQEIERLIEEGEQRATDEIENALRDLLDRN